MYSYIKNVFWLPQPNRVELHFNSSVPDLEKVAAVFVYAFNENGELLMVQEHKGTWDIPGGGREHDESIEETAKREVLEEACTIIRDIQITGYQRLLVEGQKPDNYRRPYPEAYEVFVSATVSEEHPFTPSDEMTDRRYFTPEQAVQQDGLQFENRHIIYEKAFARYTADK